MNGVDIKNFCRTDDGGDVEIALCGRCRTDAGCFIGKTNVKRIPIDITVDSDRSDTHFLARPNNPAGNLAAISDQDLLKLSRAGFHAKFQIMVQKPNAWNSQNDSRIGRSTLGSVFYSEERLAVLDRLTVLNVNLCYLTGGFSLNLVH